MGRGNDLPEISNDLERVISDMEAGFMKNNHFYTQSWYMGKPEDYDMVVHISELNKLLNFINEASELGLTPQQTNVRMNESKLKLYNSGLTTVQKMRVKELYFKDFKNGWCMQEDSIL
jgi:hypothetical protein